MTENVSTDVNRWIDHRMALAREWDDLIEQVRGLDGFRDFLRPPPLEALLPAAAGGPVVVVNVSQWRCDALVLTADGLRLIALPDLDMGTVRDRAASYLEALGGSATPSGTAPDPERKGFRAAMNEVKARHQARDDVVRSTMEWLWDAVAEPVLTELRLDGPAAPGKQPPRLWWCPTGVLSLLPLHGAGHHDGSGRTVVERVISSYTPTLRALLEARQPLQMDGQPRMLVVAVPEQPGVVELRAVGREIKLLEGLFKGRCEVLSEDTATTGAVLEAMATHPWVHFGCHGFQNLQDPSQAGLLLSDGTLRVTEIGARRFRGDLALLLSCKSATGGVNLPDEVITLAASLHYTGYRHVIGTLWAVNDDIAADVAKAFYDEMAARRFDAEAAAVALHHAVAPLRQRPDLPLVSWLPYMHIGP